MKLVDLQRLLRVMKQKERTNKPVREESQSSRKRESVLKFMLETTEKFSLHFSTCFVGIEYYDRISGKFVSDIKVQGKVGVMCLLLAAKYEEKEINVPSFSYFFGTSGSLFSSGTEMMEYERYVIEELRWDFGCVCVSHYLNMFAVIGVLVEGDTYNGNPCSHDLMRYVNQYLDFFLRLSLLEPHFSDFSPSQQAVAIIIASRRAINIVPTWNMELENKTCTSFDEAAPCYEVLWQLFKEKYPDTPKQQIKASPVNVHCESYVCTNTYPE
ncbi:cyclin [Blastocystis sp. subtype 4]|uniref:cyclin n=1 Tax=Blastocystis sp. subtype 4 TaxID=944170 RepID=UPI0007114C3B|nr:cyclin [Blastocystis sp. subtype 4]KNB42192.1 cyclin [Blastocystis sp. subtype 4]|eukprot:XP_014525635.1 cyclin [Blastocystis sp. subtype 4]